MVFYSILLVDRWVNLNQQETKKMKYIVVLFALLFICSTSLYALSMDGLVLHLSFDEGSGGTAADSSGTGNDGELSGGAEWVDGVFGGAIHFNDDAADNMVVIPDDDSLDIVEEMTISMWVNIETMPDGSCSLITKADTYMIHASDWSGNGIEQELLLWPFDAWQTEASTPIQLGEWRNVVGVYDGEHVKMYIDGQLMGERDRADDIDVTDNDLVIGRDSRDCCAGRVSKLTVDEVMIFARALSDNEVAELMEGPASIQPQDSLSSTWGQVKSSF